MSRYDDRDRDYRGGGRGREDERDYRGRGDERERERGYDRGRGYDSRRARDDRDYRRGRSRSRSGEPRRRGRSRSRSRSREGRRRDERERGRRAPSRSRSRSPRGDAKRRRSRSAEKEEGEAPTHRAEGDAEGPQGDAEMGEGGEAAPAQPIELDAELTPEELQMMQAMGIPFVRGGAGQTLVHRCHCRHRWSALLLLPTSVPAAYDAPCPKMPPGIRLHGWQACGGRPRQRRRGQGEEHARRTPVHEQARRLQPCTAG